MSGEKMRDAFEAWAVADAGATGKSLKYERGGEWYLGRDHQVMNLGWAAWQASRAAVVVEMPAPAECDDGFAWIEHSDAVKAIEAVGLKVAP